MAIDRTGISSLESGAPEIKYTGDEGPQDPRAMTDIEKIILQHWLQQGGSYGDIIPEEFKQQIIQLYGLDKMASVPEMAEGGIARLGYRFGGHPHSSDSSTGSGQTYGGAASGSPHSPGNQPVSIGTGQGQVDPGLAAGAGIGPAAAGFAGTTNVGEGDARSLDLPVAPPITGGEGSGPTGPTPAEIEAMRIKLLLLQQEADKTAADEKVAAIKKQEEEDEFLASLTRDYDFDPLEYADDRGLMYAAGGRVPAAYGGLMGNDGRRAYGLGSFFKSVTKPFKKAAKTIKKVAKSPIGKLALSYLATAGLGNIGAGGLGGAQKWGGLKWLKPSNVFGLGQEGLGNIGKTFSNIGGMFPGSTTSGSISNKETLQKAYDFHIKNKNWDTAEKIKKLIDAEGATGGLGQTAMKAASFGLPLLALKYPNLGEVPGLSMEDATAANQAAADAWAKTHLQGLDEEDWKLTSASELTPLQYSAQGGRIGYSTGGNGNGKDDSMVGISMSIEERWERIKKMLQELEDIKKGKGIDPEDKAQGGRIGYKKGGDHTDRQLALNMLSGIRSNAQEGGLMDLGGMEKDYRNEGGFVPIGGQERADDVPARLSKNEFVFTADAVRNAGGGDIDKGAEIMENLMENLEQGGKVSEESQGLEGARNMFATAQRLEGVL